mmetsp:Transcript_43048/g.71558  ORF Transcript_43048/g.71558 Transcript_43048/m.71558 type:complete len:180 (-) Transcript_43048:486-1025(-)|eukprot:CAMPEP_0119338936 /NCGR_PEP_ID=MMETSP1333-20130426/97230_1 /TAXON_ID=418940 /ORGANISM="Scyphosphaera apsteinii, Strain RCC1455" /LENGTH=179 /DNA_ID=CAMNT_0007350357 /DNA_START=137 /DNA_END=676 /DNA_ORIENTATION=+
MWHLLDRSSSFVLTWSRKRHRGNLATLQGLRLRNLCSSDIVIPQRAVKVEHSRSSGPGGQNVNKVASKVRLRLNLGDSAEWLPEDVRARLVEQQSKLVTRDGELLVSCDETRSQTQNLERARERLQQLVTAAAIKPKARGVPIQERPLPTAVKERRLDTKKVHSKKKKSRARSGGTDFG